MIILYSIILGCVDMIVFQLAERIASQKKSMIMVYEGLPSDMLAFSYLAIPTRHTVRLVPSV